MILHILIGAALYYFTQHVVFAKGADKSKHGFWFRKKKLATVVPAMNVQNCQLFNFSINIL